MDLYVNEEAFEIFLILPSYEWIKGDRCLYQFESISINDTSAI